MRRITLVGALMAFILTTPSLAAEGQGVGEYQQELAVLKHHIEALDETAAAGVITKAQAELGTGRYLAEAKELLGRDVALSEILAVPDVVQTTAPVRLSRLQKFAGFITFVNIAWVFGILIFVVSAIWLLKDLFVWIASVLVNIPIVVYEYLCWIASIGLVFSAGRFSPEVTPFVALTGCLFLVGALAFTANNRRLEYGSWFPAVLALAWGTAAVFYTSSLVGFFAILALFAALGFSVVVEPLTYVIGFKDEDAIGRATAAAFVMLGLFVFIRMFGEGMAPALSVFETGALFMGTFVGYLGILIASSRFYRGSNYAVMQVVAVVAGVLALFIGSTWSIPELQRIGGTFFALFLIEKFFDIPMERARSYAFMGLFMSGGIYAFCMAVKSNPDFWRQYLLF